MTVRRSVRRYGRAPRRRPRSGSRVWEMERHHDQEKLQRAVRDRLILWGWTQSCDVNASLHARRVLEYLVARWRRFPEPESDRATLSDIVSATQLTIDE